MCDDSPKQCWIVPDNNGHVDIKDGDTIPADAFCKCTELQTVTIGDSVTSIGDEAFDRCSNLKSITFGGKVKSIGVGAFYRCSGLTSVTIGNSVTNIGGSAFDGLSLLNNSEPTEPTAVSRGPS